jgi:hypothetical protein
MKYLIKNKNALYMYFAFLALIFSTFSTYAQDMDTLEWEEIVDLADTVYKSGMDTIYEIDDSTSESSTFRTGITDDCLLAGTAINIHLNSTVKTINKGQFGINITGMFSKSTLYGDSYSDDQWQWLSNTQPRVLRFPGGSSSKFMHLLTGDKGYGYDIVEITRYLDAIDSVLEAPENADDIISASETTYSNWFGGIVEIIDAFEDYKSDYSNQEQLSSGDRFIDHFIDLIDKIQTENGYTVDVIVCLNILTETAQGCKDIITYLEDNGVNVVGLEMGNETANKFHKQIMRFNEFEDYWKYLDGQSVSWQDDLEDELGETLFIPAADRNFFLKFKNKAGVNYKIGLCADGLDTAGHVFITTPVEYVGSRSIPWNTALQSHYGDSFSPGTTKKFHAVILHTYNAANSWYAETIDSTGIANSFTCPLWYFDTADARIQPAFDAARMNFRDFIKARYDYDFASFNTILQFNLTGSSKKDMWITEWNLKDEGTPDNGKIFSNSYQHSVLLQEWWMKNLKLNFSSGYRENFFKYSTLQNYAGGSGIQMLNPADKEVELDILGKNTFPYSESTVDSLERNYYVRRTTFFTMQLISEITKNNLQYFPATIATSGHNPNLPPTFFIDSAKNYVYMYFTNSRCNEQRYILDPGAMASMYGHPVQLEDATIYSVDAYQAYSQSGKSMIYDFNSCYNTTDYEIEIDTIYNYPSLSCTSSDDILCVKVPGFTSGYVKMHVIPYVPKEAEVKENELKIYPNPANKMLTVDSENEIQKIEIYSMVGMKVFEQVTNIKLIDITELAYGMYQIVCIFKDGSSIVKSFIKA